MALLPIDGSPTETGDTARNKLNAAIAATNDLAARVPAAEGAISTLTSNLAGEAAQRVSAQAAESAARALADANEAQARAQAVAVAQAVAQDAKSLALDVYQPERPGDGPSAFTASLAGGPASGMPPLAITPIVGPNGAVVPLYTSGILARRHTFAVEPGRTYYVRYVYTRAIAAADPSNDAIECAIVWLDANKVPLSSGSPTIIDTNTDPVTGTRVVKTALLSLTDGDDIAFVIPPGTCYSDPYIQAFGGPQRTDAEVISWIDVTDATIYSPDVSALIDAVNSLLSLPGTVAALATAVTTAQSAADAAQETADGAATAAGAAQTSADTANAGVLSATGSIAQSQGAALAGYDTVAERVLTGTFALATGYGGYAAGIEVGTGVAAATSFDAVAGDVILSTSAAFLHLKLYSRLSTGGNADGLPGQVSDTLLEDVTVTVASAGALTDGSVTRAVIRLAHRRTTVAGTTLIPSVEALDSSGTAIALGFGFLATTGEAQHRRGWVRATPGAGFTGLASTVTAAWGLCTSRLLDVAGVDSAVASMRKGLADGYDVVAQIAPTSSFPVASGYGGFVAGIEVGASASVAAGVLYDTIAVDVILPTTADSVRVRLYGRSTADVADGLPRASSDILIDTVTTTPALAGLQPDGVTLQRAYIKATRAQVTQAGLTYLVAFDAFDSTGTKVAVGFGFATTSGQAQHRRGWFYGTTSATSYGAITSTTTSISWGLCRTRLADVSGVSWDADTAGASAAGARGALLDTYDLTHQLARTNVFALASAFGGVALPVSTGTDVPAGEPFDAIGADLQVGATANQLRVALWLRQATGANVDGLPGQATDKLLENFSVAPADVGLLTDGTTCTVVIPLPRERRPRAGMTYVATIEAYDASGTKIALGFGFASTTGQPAHRRGWYRTGVSATAWTVIGTTVSVAWALYQASLHDVTAIKSDLLGVTAQSGALADAFDEQVVPTGLRVANSTGFASSLGFGSWAGGGLGGVDIPLGKPITAVSMMVSPTAASSTMRVHVWGRPSASASSTSSPGAAGDVLLETVSLGTAAMGLPTDGVAYGKARWPLPTPIDPNGTTIYLLEVDFLASDGTTKLAFGVYRSTDVYANQYQRGWYRNISLGTIGNIASGSAIGWEFDATAYRLAYSDSSTLDRVTSCAASASGLVVTIDPANSVLDRVGGAVPFGGSITLDATTTGTVTAEARTLSFLPLSYAAAAGLGGLTYANVSSVVVKDASTNAVLTLGTDYLLSAEYGLIVLPASGSDRPVKVDYAYAKRRYTKVCLDPETLALSAVNGTERIRDPAEFMPATPAGLIPVLSCRVVGTSVEIVAVWDVENGVRRQYAAAAERELKRGRACVRPVLRKLRMGLPVTAAFYGTSLVGFPGVSSPLSSPNGTTRDLPANFFSPAILSDVAAALTKYDWGDGAGAVHGPYSYMWRIILAMQAAYGSDITVLNLGIGGSTSANTTGNGTDPDRLAELVACNADVVFIDEGMNEIGASFTLANVITIAQTAQGGGACTVIHGCPRPNALHPSATYAGWLLTNRLLYRAAVATGSAFLDTVGIFADENLGVLGMSKYDLSASNSTNHYGNYEGKVVSGPGSRLFLYE